MMKSIASFFNSPPPKGAVKGTEGTLNGFIIKKTEKKDENFNGHDAVEITGMEEKATAKVNGIQKISKDKNKLSRKKSGVKDNGVKDKAKVDDASLVIEVDDDDECKDAKETAVKLSDNSDNVEMSYEDFLTISDDPKDEQEQNEISKNKTTTIKENGQGDSAEDTKGMTEISYESLMQPMDSEDSQTSQDLFSEDVVAGCPFIKTTELKDTEAKTEAVLLVEEKGKPKDDAASELSAKSKAKGKGPQEKDEKVVKEKKTSKLSRKAKKEGKVCDEESVEVTEPSESEKPKKKATKLSKSKGKQMTLFGKVIDNVPKLEGDTTDADSEAKVEDENEDNEIPSESLPSEAAPKAKSIMNFFNKVDKKSGIVKKPCSEKVTCKVEIHTPTGKSSVEVSPSDDARKKISPRRKSNVAVEQIDMSITELGSQLITVVEKKKRSRRQLNAPSDESIKEIEDVRKSTDSDVICLEDDVKKSDSATNCEESVEPMEIADSPEKPEQPEKFEVADDKPQSDDDLLIVGATDDAGSIEKDLRKAQLADQMAILDTVKVPVKKSTQATLNFSGKGCLIQKAVVEKVEEKKSKKAAKSEKTEESDFEDEINDSKKKAGKKNAKKKVKTRFSKDENITPPKVTRSRKISIESPIKTPSKKVYSAKILPPRRNSLPGLRMKFTSIRNTSASESKLNQSAMEELAKITAKMSKAQQILDKAKKASHTVSKGKQQKSKTLKITPKVATKQEKEVEEVEEEESPPRRRSSRQSSMVAKSAISECLSPADFQTPKGKNKEKKSSDSSKCPSQTLSKTPAKTPKSRKSNLEKCEGSKTPKRTPSKKKVKMAPIFKGKANKEEDSDDDVEVTKVQLDPELVRVRREFLLSGVPSVLKKQAEAACAVSIDDHPPLPEISHVQQHCEDDRESAMFKLGEVTVAKLKPDVDVVLEEPASNCLNKGSFTESVQDVPCNVKLNGADGTAFEEETVKYLLAEISSRNPSFPVRRVYKQLVKKYEQTKGTWVEPSKPEEKEETKSNKKNQKKRKLLLGESEEPARRSKRRRAGSDVHLKEDDCSIVEEPPKPENIDKSRELLWTDKYSPASSTEVLTSSMHSKRLKTWLEEWRQQTDLEMKKIKKQLMKEAKKDSKIKEEIQKSLGDSWWTDDESDFEIDTEDDSDYEGEEIDDGLCNTMVLTGPHGVGKTAMVYAVAQELGYKIFEVNASSKRAGKQMLAELQEATQSHQVAQRNMDKLFTTFKMIQSERRKSLEVTKPKKVNPMFANFFTNSGKSGTPPQPAAKGKAAKTPKKTPEKAPKAKKGASPAKATLAQKMSPKKGLNLNSTSLILFEEVDVLFEEDKGFWTAIETFMNTTKRPIILTASDPKVAAAVNRRHEVIKIKTSPMVNVTSYLQLVCLAEKLRVDHDDVMKLVASCNGDLRRAILTLQYWIQSGAGCSKFPKPIKYDPVFFNKKQDNAPKSFSGQFGGQPSHLSGAPLLLKEQHASAFDSGKDSEEEFEITSFSRKRRRNARPMLDSGDESSNASPVKPLKFKSTLPSIPSDSAAEDSQDGFAVANVKVTEKELTVAPVVAPAIHGLMWQSSSGPQIQGVTSNADLLQVLQNPVTSSRAWQLVSWYLSSQINLVYANLLQLLDLPKVQLVPPRLPVVEPDVKKRRRIKMNSDIFDSENSDSETENDAKDATETDDKMDVDNASVALSGNPEGKNKENQTDNVPKQTEVATVEDAVAISGVKILSDLYDNLSYSDAHFSSAESILEGPCGRYGSFSYAPGQLNPGLADSYNMENCPMNDTVTSDLHAGLLLYSTHGTSKRLQDLKQKTESLDADCRKKISKLLCLPVPSERLNSELQLSRDCASHVRVRSCRKLALEHVSSCLPLNVHCSRRAVTCDVMPYVRNICQSEQVRQAANTKRRFTHYFDSVSLGVTKKQTVMDVLCTSFT